MAKDENDRPFSEEWLDQKDHERAKVWMIEHRWSVSIFTFDPADIYEILETLGIEDVDIDEITEQLTNQSKG